MLLSWSAETAGEPKTDLDLWVFPCTDSGAWDVAEAGACNGGSPRPDFDSEGIALAQGAVYWGCPAYTSRSGADGAVVLDVDALEGPGPESVSLEAAPNGTYDVWVNTYDGGPLWGTASVDFVWRTTGADGRYNTSVRTVRSPAESSGDWWHVGYVTVADSVPALEVLNMRGSSPEKSGCRISPATATRSFAVDAAATQSLGPFQGVTISVPTGVWPSDAGSSLSVAALAVLPAPPPAGATAAGAGVYFEPSGTQFAPPGVQVALVVNLGAVANATISSQFDLVVHRLSGGVWEPLVTQGRSAGVARPSSVEVRFNTLSFSAYVPMLVPPPPPAAAPAATTPAPPPAVNATGAPAVVATPWAAVFGGAAAGLLALAAAAFSVAFRLRAGRWPWERKPLPFFPPDPEHLPHLDPIVLAVRSKLVAAEQQGRARGVRAENSATSVTARSALSGHNVAELTLAVKAQSIEEGGDKAVAFSLKALRSPPSGGVSVPSRTEPPAAISELVRSGVLMPNRSSVVDRPSGRHSLGVGGPTKLEVPGDISVIGDFARTTERPLSGGGESPPTLASAGRKEWRGGLQGSTESRVRSGDPVKWKTAGEPATQGSEGSQDEDWSPPAPAASDVQRAGLPWLSQQVASLGNGTVAVDSLLDTLGFSAPTSTSRSGGGGGGKPLAPAGPGSSLDAERKGLKGKRTKVQVSGPSA